jgi:RimJ/RimL family protein N-acetyltransferase
VSRGPQLKTERLWLRRWRPGDLGPLAAMNADPEVMEHFPATLSRAQSAAMIERFEASFESHGYGLWAVEAPGRAGLIGFVGLSRIELEVPFAPAVEVGWRLARAFWGEGLATEAARASLAFGFAEIGLPEIVSFTSERNVRSRAVMERLQMRRDHAEDFDHPLLPVGDPLRRHVLYRVEAPRAGDERALLIGE